MSVNHCIQQKQRRITEKIECSLFREDTKVRFIFVTDSFVVDGSLHLDRCYVLL